MGKTVKIRPAGAAEFDEVAAFCAGRGHDPETAEIRRGRRRWLEQMSARRLTLLWAVDAAPPAALDFPEGRVAREELTLLTDGLAVGLLEYLPVGEAFYPVEGRGWWFIDCLWIIPPYRGRGIGRALAAEVIRVARADETGIAAVAWRGPSPFKNWALMPEGFFRALGFEVVAEEGNRVIVAVSYGARGTLAFASPAGAAPERGLEFLCHPSCPASMWAGREVAAAAAAGEPVAVVEVASREEAFKRGALFGVCRGGKPVVNRLAFKNDVDKLKPEGERP